MGSYAQINGQSITSDKPGVISIIGGIVVFGDGSSYNPATGAFINRGSGSVYVNGRLLGSGPQDAPAPQDAAAASSGERVFDRFDARGLVLNVSSATCTVEPHMGDGMAVKLTGPQEVIDAFEVTVVNDQLCVTERIGKKGAGNYISSGGGVVIGSFIWSGGDIIGNVSIGGQPVKVSVHIPVGTPITASINGSGDVAIGNVRGGLDATIHGSGGIQTQSATDFLVVAIRGSGDMTVQNAQVNRLSVTVQGSGDVRIKGGSAKNAMIVVQGSGDVEFDGTASGAYLQCSGSGGIRVHHCLTKPIKTKHGSGDIRVAHVG